jgi:hypothetical protein
VNVLGVLQSDVATAFFVDSAGSVLVPEERISWYPDQLAAIAPPGHRAIARSMAGVLDPAFSPIVTHAFLLRERMAGGSRAEITERLANPPWLASHPEAVPAPHGTSGETSGILLAYLTEPFRWPTWGRALRADPETRRLTMNDAWREGLIDQILRALDTGRSDRAVELATEYWSVSQTKLGAALLAESLREAQRPADLHAFLQSLNDAGRSSADMSVVLALMARDAGKDVAARAILAEAGPVFRTQAMRQALASDPRDWPATYRDLTR